MIVESSQLREQEEKRAIFAQEIETKLLDLQKNLEEKDRSKTEIEEKLRNLEKQINEEESSKELFKKQLEESSRESFKKQLEGVENEKRELEEMVKQIQKQIEDRLKEVSELREELKKKVHECPICFNEFEGFFMSYKCGHTICEDCVDTVTECPTCRTTIVSSETRKIYF